MWRLLVWALGMAAPLAAQKGMGELWLEVKDPAGSPLEARGELLGQATSVRLTFVTDAAGRFRATAVPFGPYVLTLSRVGFQEYQAAVEIRSELPVRWRAVLGVAPVETVLVIRERDTLLDQHATATAYYIGKDQMNEQRSVHRSRDLLDLVNAQPGWLLEANGVLHPRGSEYNTQYVIDGIPITDNRSPAFAPGLELEDLGAIRVLTGGYPAEYGRKLGGVVEVTSNRDPARGLRGRASVDGGSFATRAAYVSLQHGWARTSASLAASTSYTRRFLDPPAVENYSNRASGAGFTTRLEHDFTEWDRLSLYLHGKQVGFLVPNEPAQEGAGQRQDRRHEETMGQAAYRRVVSPSLLADMRVMARDYSSLLWSNPLATPILADGGRGFREAYLGASLAWNRGRHAIKGGAEGAFTRLEERFAWRITEADFFDDDIPGEFRFDDRGRSRETGLYLQDLISAGRFTFSVGARWDRYSLRVRENAFSPRLGVGYFIAPAGLRLHASYDRAFETPPVEGVLLASSPAARQLTEESTGLPIHPSRSHFYQAGFAKSLVGRMRLEGNYYRRKTRHFTDDSLLLNTGISFPISFARAEIRGVEGKLELPEWRGLSGYVSYANMTGTGWLPLTGGLFLEEDTALLLASTGSFPITQDQRNTMRGRVRHQPHRRVWFAAGASYDSGLPFEREEAELEPDEIARRFSERITSRVDFERGRLRSLFSFDTSVGVLLHAGEAGQVRLQADLWNLTNRLNVVNFSGLFSGTALGRPRSGSVRLTWEF